ncbi:glycosyltransferase [Streptomyces griseorubiginosus]|uniref:glycosyltransferase n=1 Tax=Streptomyces griseorubiginosus TaxID=67304 RepID=UPI0036E9A218
MVQRHHTFDFDHRALRSVPVIRPPVPARLLPPWRIALPALPNADVRRLQRALAARPQEAPCWYVCPSAKEEFGIAILEAMEAGLPAAGPQRGGVAHYLRDGVNGILMDTSTPTGLMRGLRRLTHISDDERRRYATAGQNLVAERFSVTRMAKELTAEYVALERR